MFVAVETLIRELLQLTPAGRLRRMQTIVNVLTSKYNSRRNKMALLAHYRSLGYDIPHKWAGEPYNSRLLLQFDGEWVACKSYDEDIRPLLKSGRTEVC